MKRICVYCGSSTGNKPEYLEAAYELGRTLAYRNIELVYGGASIGVMGATADAVLSAGGRAIGVLPKLLMAKEIAHGSLTELIRVDTMHQRKLKMYELSDAFVALPGGYGTFEELFEMLTWQQLGVHQKPCGLLNVNGYYDPLLNMLNRSHDEGFVSKDHRQMLVVATSIPELFSKLEGYIPPPLPHWLTSAAT